MADVMEDLPALTFIPKGQPYRARANHFGLRFAASSAPCSRWLCWEVDVQWADAHRQANRPPGKAQIQAAVEAVVSQIPELGANATTTWRWIFDGVRRLYTRADVDADVARQGGPPTSADRGTIITVKRSITKEGVPQEIDVSKLRMPVLGDVSEEQRFVQVYLRRQAAAMGGHVAVGRRIYIEEASVPRYLRDFPRDDLVQGRAMWLGYFASVEPSIGELPLGSAGCIQLNVNVTAGFGISQQGLQHFIGSLVSGKSEDERQDSLHSFWEPWDTRGQEYMATVDEEHWRGLRFLNAKEFGIKNIKVVTPYLGRKNVRVVRQISAKPPHALWFRLDDGHWTNVQEYLHQHRSIKLKYPWLPCVDLGKGPREDWVPIELVEVLGGQFNFARKVSDEMLERMVRRLAMKPEERLEWIRQVLWDVPSQLPGLGLEVNWEPVELQLRKIPAPVLKRGARGREGDSLAFQHGFFNPSHACAVNPPGSPVRWLMLNYVPEFQWDDVESLCDAIVQTAWDRGAVFEKRTWIEEHGETERGRLREYVQQHCREVDMVVALLPPNSPIYGYLKAACAELGVHSACLNPLDSGKGKGKDKGKEKGKGKGKGKGEELAGKKVAMFVNKILGNLGTLLKLKAPHPLLSEGTMVLGADVRHQSGLASIAGAVASFGPDFVGYYSSCRAQMPRHAQEGERQRKSREHIEDFEGMVGELLRHHSGHGGQQPTKVIVCRDGVSDGQFHQQQEELVGLYRAFEAQGAPRPQVAWLVVQKRHGTRFFPGQGAEALPNGNVVPGVVADRGIANPSYENWFAVSHKAIQGTAVPAHYFVLRNTLGASKDDLVEVMNQLCHLYPRASCAVSYPTPAYYADHLCERAFELGVNMRELTDCAQLNEYFQGPEFKGSRLQGTNFFC